MKKKEKHCVVVSTERLYTSMSPNAVIQIEKMSEKKKEKRRKTERKIGCCVESSAHFEYENV